MNDDPNEVDVLYARVHANEILQRLVDDIVDYFFNAGDDNLEKDLFSDDQIVEKVVEEANEQGIPEDSDDQAEKNQTRRGEKSTSVGRNLY
ncbi:hypothetical protein J6590_038654 [Homalodisca vitripennis]|nr:hypothetical protein J6590_038654 [Homalodisca vitripennis]